MKIEAAVVQDHETGLGRVAGQPGSDLEPADRYMALAARLNFLVEGFHLVAIDDRVRFRSVINQANGIVREDPVEVHFRWANQLLPDAAAILEARHVARRLFQDLDNLFLAVQMVVLGQLQSAGRVAQTLSRFQAAQIVEEPAATGKHELAVPFHFQESQGLAHFPVAKRRLGSGVFIQETAYDLLAPVLEHVNVGIASCPEIAEELLAANFKKGV